MQAVPRNLYCTEIEDLEGYLPDEPDNFRFLLRAMVGPSDGEGEESFDVYVCTPKWLIENNNVSDVLLGLHKIIAFQYDYRRLRGFIEKYLMRCSGESWGEVARKASLLGHWEFEGYRP